jgi:hypothetical protein
LREQSQLAIVGRSSSKDDCRSDQGTVGIPTQLTDIERCSEIVVVNLSAADRREVAVIHVNAVHVRNPGSRGIHDVRWADFIQSLELIQESLRRRNLTSS